VLPDLQSPVSNQQAEEAHRDGILKESNLPGGRTFVTGKSDFHSCTCRQGRGTPPGLSLMTTQSTHAEPQPACSRRTLRAHHDRSTPRGSKQGKSGEGADSFRYKRDAILFMIDDPAGRGRAPPRPPLRGTTLSPVRFKMSHHRGNRGSTSGWERRVPRPNAKILWQVAINPV